MPEEAERFDVAAVMQRTEANSTAIALLKQSVDDVRSSVSNLTTTVNAYIKSDLERKQPNWAQWGVLASFIVAIVAGIWVVLALKINAEVYPLAQEIAQNKVFVNTLANETSSFRDRVSGDVAVLRDKVALITSQNQASLDDRSQLNKALLEVQRLATANQAAISTEITERSANEREIETQFDADGQLRNLQFVEQQRLNAILWNMNSNHMGAYPTAPFFMPNISSRNHKAGSISGGTGP